MFRIAIILVLEVLEDGNSPLTERLLVMIAGNQSLTIEEMARTCKASRPTVNRAIKALKGNANLRRGGMRGPWEVPHA